MGREARANAERREQIHAVASAITGYAVDDGHLIALGFASMIQAMCPEWKNMPEAQRDDLRAAFFGGAQHLWGSIMNILDPGTELTARDLRRMELIHHELEAFIEDYKRRHGVTDPDLGPPAQIEN